MSVFQADTEEKRKFDHFTSGLAALTERLRDAADESDIRKLTELRENFDRKTEDFFRENRKLNIGVMGQVKAGKSSFLNTLLFGGAAMLPKASTPKTATLTKMEYGEENAIRVEYYTSEDWDAMRRNAAVDSEDEVFASARQLVDMAGRSGIDAADCIAKGGEYLRFADYDELSAHLNDYVGEDGRYTPLVKSVTLYLNEASFRELSIVDTPGLNDPIVSRTVRTKEFMELCDVVFFLSQAGSFLDKSDWTLLSAQLPQKGVRRLALIASKGDSALRDVLRVQDKDNPFGDDPNTASNLKDASKLVTGKLKKRARSQVDKFVQELQSRTERPEEMIRVVEECRKPILISAMAQNMAGKPAEEYDAEERNVYEALAKFSDDLRGELPRVGNIDAVRAVYEDVVAEKERILAEKSAGFVPAAREELIGEIKRFLETARSRRAVLSDKDRASILAQKDEISRQINDIKADIKG
ncbi:MAG: dynamin family protein, partial [Clostridiales Family XIII bacterium]|nr:dynamin family protein [Clostridiales Family XIII bacterium]